MQEFLLAQSWGLADSELASATFHAAAARSGLEERLRHLTLLLSFLKEEDKKELGKQLRRMSGIEDRVELEIFINHKCGQPDDPRKVLKTSF